MPDAMAHTPSEPANINEADQGHAAASGARPFFLLLSWTAGIRLFRRRTEIRYPFAHGREDFA
jgi:hypothetical protein